MPILNTILNKILDIIFPIYCIECGSKGKELCINCISNIREAERETLRWIYPLYDYRHPPLKKILHLFKYKGKKNIAKILGEMLYGKIIEELSELSILNNFTEPILIPIPLSHQRSRERGYNQTELICEELIKIDRNNNNTSNFILLKNVLIKNKDTEHQARIHNRPVRLKNVIGSFIINKDKINLIKNKNIILIDDITTTGATLSEAKKMLKNAGAKKIIAFTIAH
jgi:competence protein ComFC